MQVFLLTLDLQQSKKRVEQNDVRHNSTIEFYFVNFFRFYADEDVLIFSLSEYFPEFLQVQLFGARGHNSCLAAGTMHFQATYRNA